MPTLYVTVPRAAAADVASEAVESGLAACVNRVDCCSTYRWEGSVQRDEEAILLVKTTDQACEALVDRIESVHPHDVPCIERFDETDVVGAFADWRAGAVDPGSG